MSGESAARSDNKPSETVPLAEHEILKRKYETLTREHETLINTLELLEKKYVFTEEEVDPEKKQREAVVAKEEVEKWEKKFGELKKNLEKVEKDIEDLMSLDETEMNGMDSGSATLAKNLNVNRNTVSDPDVIEISDDDESNERESNGRHINSQNSEFSFFL